ncbi:MAG: hypothetical protein JWM11_2735, partial [Planctomycetaceae bacterium]|nr:hypothetical protein [Planctomycetaceae bacterium]
RIAQGRPDDAWKLLQECRKQMPDDLLIAAACLTCLEERADLDGYTAMAMRLPPMSDVDPVSLLRHRGQVALRNDQTLEAVTSFQRALALDPAHVPSRMGLAQAWLILKQPERRKQELNATQDLARIQNRLGLAASKTPTPEVMLEIVQLSTDAGLQTAAADVCRISLRLFKEPARFEKLLHKLTKDSSAGRAP